MDMIAIGRLKVNQHHSKKLPGGLSASLLIQDGVYPQFEQYPFLEDILLLLDKMQPQI